MNTSLGHEAPPTEDLQVSQSSGVSWAERQKIGRDWLINAEGFIQRASLMFSDDPLTSGRRDES